MVTWLSNLGSWTSRVVVALALTACGGVGTDGTGGASISVGVVTGLGDGTVTVNGVTFDRSKATVSDAFDQALGAEALRLGMWLEVTGVVDEEQGTASAQSIRVRPTVRGQVSAVDGSTVSVTVLGTTVRYDDVGTVIEGAETAGAILAGDVVEVHGPLSNAPGNVDASRIERLATAFTPAQPVELRGRVSNLDTVARTLTVGRQPVRYDAASLTLRRALANGQVVRVSAAAAPAPSQPWRVERMTSDQSLPDNLGFVYVEGVTSAWTAGPIFELEGVSVNATTANDRTLVSGDGQRVAVIGSLSAGVLNAKSVARSLPGQPVVFVLGGAISDYKSIADFRVRGVAINATSATFVGGNAQGLVDTRRVRVTGNVSGTRLIATRVEYL